MLKRKIKRIDKEQAFQKLKHCCSYQERWRQEAKEKLYSFGLYKQEVEELLSRLIEENYLNEERFALAYASGKFRMKGWGKIKILQGLKDKRVSSYCMNKAMSAIDEGEYESALQKFAVAKWKTLKSEPNLFIKMRKTQDYLLQKGYERNLISEVLRNLKRAEED